MKPFVLSVIRSKAFKAIVGIIAAALTAYASAGCGAQPKSPALSVFQCRVAAVAPFVGEAAPNVVTAIAGSDNPIQLLFSLGLEPDDIVDVIKAYRACDAAKDAGAPDAAPADAALPPVERS